MSACLIAITAAFRRPVELQRLLSSLASEPITSVVVVDNGRDQTTATIAAAAPHPTHVVTPERNLGCGGGVGLGLTAALARGATHVWLFDDDAFATPGAGSALLRGLNDGRADAAVPLVTDAHGRVRWFPGPLPEPAWSVIRRGPSAEAFRARCGTGPWRWSWAPWTSLMVTRRAIEVGGVPRTDFGFQGEDIEWSLRLSQRFTCILRADAECRHCPPGDTRDAGLAKHAAMLQNTAFIATHLPHGRRIAVHVPGNVWRFLRAGRFRAAVIAAATRALWRGVVAGRPVGAAQPTSEEV